MLTGQNLNYIFSIKDNGDWIADFDFDFQQDTNSWRYQDYSRWDSTAAHRARILANPESKGEITWTFKKYDLDLSKLEELKKLDFSFQYNWKSSGNWI